MAEEEWRRGERQRVCEGKVSEREREKKKGKERERERERKQVSSLSSPSCPLACVHPRQSAQVRSAA